MLCLQEGHESMQRMNAKECLLGDEYPVMPRTPKDLVVAPAKPHAPCKRHPVLPCPAKNVPKAASPTAEEPLPLEAASQMPGAQKEPEHEEPFLSRDQQQALVQQLKPVKGPGGRGRGRGQGRGRGRGQGRGKPVAVDNEDDNDGEVGLDNDGDDEREEAGQPKRGKPKGKTAPAAKTKTTGKG